MGEQWMVTMGLSGLERHEPLLGEVCISIGSPGERLPDATFCFADCLRVEFCDDQWDGWEARGKNLTKGDAERIVRFVKVHRDAPRLTIHCAAGASRSVSIAQALALVFGIDHPRALILNYGAYWRIVNAPTARKLLSMRSLSVPEGDAP